MTSIAVSRLPSIGSASSISYHVVEGVLELVSQYEMEKREQSVTRMIIKRKQHEGYALVHITLCGR